MLQPISFELDEGKFSDSFHVFEIEWDDHRIAWSIDGKEYASTAISSNERSEFLKELFILFTLAVGGKWAGQPDSTTPFPQHMFIDWVRVYQK